MPAATTAPVFSADVVKIKFTYSASECEEFCMILTLPIRNVAICAANIY